MVSSGALGAPGSASVVMQLQDWGGAQAPSELASSSMGCLSVSRRSRAFEPPHTQPLRTARCLTLVRLYVDCLPSVCPQEDVYLATTQQLVEGVVSGYNATVFAYGPSGTARAVSWEGGRSVAAGPLTASQSTSFLRAGGPLCTWLLGPCSSPKATGSARRSPRPPTRRRPARTRCCRSSCAGAAAAHTRRRRCASAGSSWWTWRARSGRPRFASSPSPPGSLSVPRSRQHPEQRPAQGRRPPNVCRAKASSAGAGGQAASERFPRGRA